MVIKFLHVETLKKNAKSLVKLTCRSIYRVEPDDIAAITNAAERIIAKLIANSSCAPVFLVRL